MSTADSRDASAQGSDLADQATGSDFYGGTDGPRLDHMMDRLNEERNWLTTGSLVVLAVVAIGATLIYTRGVLVPFVFSVFVASVASPLLDHQVVRWKFSHIAGVVVTMLVVILVFVAFGVVILNAIQNVAVSVSTYSTNAGELADQFMGWLKSWNIPVDGADMVRALREEAPKLATSAAAAIAGTVPKMLAQSVLVFIFVGFLLASRDPFVIRRSVYADIDTQVRRYIGTKLVISAVTGLLVWFVLSFLNLELASVFGLLAFLLNFIPSVGSIIATLLPIPTAAAQFSDRPWIMAAVVLIPGAIQITIGNVIEPKLMGDGMKLHPVTVLLSLAVWGLLWGPIGMLLAVPMMAALRIVFDQFEITQPASRVLTGQLPGAD